MRQVIVGVLVSVLLVFFVRACVLVDDTPPIPDAVRADDQMYVLLVGCSDYPHLKTQMDDDTYRSTIWLEGPINDVALMRTVFEKYLGVPPENVTTLAGWPEDASQRPTRANILGHFTAMQAQLKEGDRFVFHFAGHGSHQPDSFQTGELDELDRRDEILLPADVTSWDRQRGRVVGSITDDELWAHAYAIRTECRATVWLSLDCCNSGGAMRGDDIKLRGVEPDVLGTPALEGSRGAAPPVQRAFEDIEGIVATSAAQSDQSANETKLPKGLLARDRKFHGLYTFLLARTLQNYGGDVSFAELHQHLVAGYQATPWDAAVPYMQGDHTLKVSPHYAADHVALYVTRADNDAWILNAGAIRGIHKGSTYDVYRPHAGDVERSHVGAVRVEEVGVARSTCVPMGETELPDTDRPLPVAVRDAAMGDLRIPLAVVTSPGTAPGSLSSKAHEIASDPALPSRFPLVEAGQADWILKAGPESGHLMRVEPGAYATAFEVTPSTLASMLDRIYRAQRLRELRDVLPDVPKDVRIDVYTLTGPDGAREPLRPGKTLVPGTLMGLEIRNRTQHAIDLTVLMLNANYGIEVFYPSAGWPLRLAHDETKAVEFEPAALDDSSLGTETILVFAALRDTDDPQLDFRCLQQESLPRSRGEPQSISNQLYTWALGDQVSRGSTSVATEAVGLRTVSWRTRWAALHVPERIRAQGVALDLVHRQVASSKTSPWFAGTSLAVLRNPTDATHHQAQARAVVTWNDQVEQIYLCAGTAYAAMSADGAADHIAAGTLPADLVIRLERGQRTVWYASSDNGARLDQVFIDDRGDENADSHGTWAGGDWTTSPTTQRWLSTERISTSRHAHRAAIISRLRDFVWHP